MKGKRAFFYFILFFIGLCIALGTWQLQRKGEKEALIHSLEMAQKASPENVDSLKTPKPFQHLFAEGHFVANKTIFLQAKTYKGKSGVYVLSVFKTREGQFLLVQRGWASREIVTHPEGILRLEGILREPSIPNYFQPHNTPPTYFWIDMNLLSQTLNVPLLPYYLVATSSFDTNIYPVKPVPSLPNNHLEYAITWYLLAFVLGCMLWWHKYFYLKKV